LDESTPVNQTTVAMASKLSRPVRTKKAKAITKAELATESFKKEQLEMMRAVAIANADIAKTLKRKTQIAQFSQLVDVYLKLGDVEQARKLAEEMRQVMNEGLVSEETTHVAPDASDKSMFGGITDCPSDTSVTADNTNVKNDAPVASVYKDFQSES